MFVSQKTCVKITAALLAVITVLVTVFALCACTPADTDGVEIVGVISKEKYSVEITKLGYKLNVSEFPSVSLEGFGDYDSYFTVDYEFYNSADSDCVMTLYSPAMLPQYAQREIFSAKQYSVKVNGEDTETVYRYSLNRAATVRPIYFTVSAVLATVKSVTTFITAIVRCTSKRIPSILPLPMHAPSSTSNIPTILCLKSRRRPSIRLPTPKQSP